MLVLLVACWHRCSGLMESLLHLYENLNCFLAFYNHTGYNNIDKFEVSNHR